MDGFLQSLGLEKYLITFQAEEVQFFVFILKICALAYHLQEFSLDY